MMVLMMVIYFLNIINFKISFVINTKYLFNCFRFFYSSFAGQYDPRFNDPNFTGTGRSSIHVPQAAPVHQPAPQQYHQPAPQQYVPQPQQPSYNHNVNNVHYSAQYQSTTPHPHRFQPPGKLSLSRTPDGFSYSFNKV